MVFGNNVHSDLSGRTGGPGPPALTAQTIESIPADTTVRDFDQLSPRESDCFLDLVAAEGHPVHAPAVDGLEAGEVIVFTEYYRVELTE